MATTKTSLEEYLSTTYRPDAEYIDGELRERNVGELEHSRMVKAIMRWFERYEAGWQVEALPDVRVQVSAENYRVPDICLRPLANPDVRFVTAVPAAVIEVLSPEDSVSDYRERIADYRRKGITGIWIVDPATRQGWDCSSGDWIETVVFKLSNSPIYLDLSAIR
jgi:Uma2 family endonuclease